MQNYTAEVDDCFDDDTPVWGCGCTGFKVKDVNEIEDCSLTPGDPSPIGRCPDCDALVYPDTKKHRAQESAEELLEAVKYLFPRVHRHLAEYEQLEKIKALVARIENEEG